MSEKKLKQLIRKYAKWWIRWTGLGYWTINLDYEDVVRMDHGGYDTCAVCECDWKYQQATITFGLDKLRGMKKDTIERTVLHELMHIFLNEMRADGIDHEERTATQLAKAFIWVRDGVKND